MAENIFAEIYNKILGLFGQAEPKEDSKNTAVSRLRLVLMQDRTNLTPEIMHRMRMELIEVLSTYVELDKEALELNFEQEGEQMALMLSIPVVRAKDEAEIEAALKEKDAKKEQDDEDDSEDSETSEDIEESDAQDESDENEGEEILAEDSQEEENSESASDEETVEPSTEQEEQGEENPQAENTESSEQAEDNKPVKKEKKVKKEEN